MNWSKLWSLLSLSGVALLIFTLGYVVGGRMFDIKNQPTLLDIRNWNGATTSPLSEIKKISLFGRSSESEIKQVGEMMFYKTVSRLDFVLQLDSLPTTFNLSDKQFVLPTSLQIYSAVLNENKTNYTTKQIGVINLVQKDRVLMGKFPGSIDLGQVELERLLFVGSTGSSDLPPGVSLDFLPATLKNQPAPYAWSDTLANAN